MREIVKKWKDILEMVKCTEDVCTGYVKYETDSFTCHCRKLRLVKET